MEREYQHLPCSNPDCDAILRMVISEANYGRNVEVTCPVCRTKSQTVIVDRNKLKNLSQKLSSAAREALSESDKVSEVMREIIKAGFRIGDFILGLELVALQQQKPPELKVLDGKIKLNFTSDDEKLAKSFHIKLED